MRGRRTLVVGWDDTARGRDALALAGTLARDCGLAVRIVHVYPGYALDYSPELIDGTRRGEGTRLDAVPLELVGDVPVELALTPAASPAEGLHREIRTSAATMVVVGSTGRGAVGRVLAGSVAERLLHGAPAAVAVAPAGYAEAGPRRLAVVAAAWDETPQSRSAVDRAVAIATAAGAGLKVISVVVPPGAAFAMAGAAYAYASAAEELRESQRRALEDFVASLPDALRAEATLRSGDAASEIAAECESGVDLLVVGSRRYGAVRRTLLGSVSTALVRSLPCPVLVVPATEEEDVDERG